MKIAIGADHAGFELKQTIVGEVVELGYDVVDVGAKEYEPLDDYPDFALLVGEAITKGHADRGIVVCGSGIGACIASNKIVGIRAGICPETYSAHQGVEHDDMNVLVLGSRVMGIEVVREVVKSFLSARFSGEERHVRRLNKVLEIEAEFSKPGLRAEG
jgi:ribose 5-phosphate isomerase B